MPCLRCHLTMSVAMASKTFNRFLVGHGSTSCWDERLSRSGGRYVFTDYRASHSGWVLTSGRWKRLPSRLEGNRFQLYVKGETADDHRMSTLGLGFYVDEDGEMGNYGGIYFLHKLLWRWEKGWCQGTIARSGSNCRRKRQFLCWRTYKDPQRSDKHVPKFSREKLPWYDRSWGSQWNLQASDGLP